MTPFRYTLADAAMPPLVDPTAMALIAIFVFLILPTIIGVIVLVVLKRKKRKTPAAVPPISNTPYPDQVEREAPNEQPGS